MVKTCEGIDVVPLELAPVMPDGTIDVQLIITPLVDDVMLTALLVSPEQIVWFEIENVVVGVGFTTIETVIGMPVHPRELGVTVYTTVKGALVLFTNNCEITLSDPDEAPVTPDGTLTVQL